MELPVQGSTGKRTPIRAFIVPAVILGLVTVVVYFAAIRQGAGRVSAEQAKLIDIALSSDDEAERRMASRRLAGLNRAALDQIKRLNVVITTYSSADMHVSLSLPETAKKLLESSGVAVADPVRLTPDAILDAHACCKPDWANYIRSGKQFSGAEVEGTLVVETEGRVPWC